ncbi:MAG: calcium-binding protein [bacterium]
MNANYDKSWDYEETEDGNIPRNEEAYKKKWAEWKNRDWMQWLQQNLSFPFMVERVEDDDDAYFGDIAENEPFTLGHKMKVLELTFEDAQYGIIVKVREGRKVGHVPLCDLEVTSKSDKNYWPVREYVVWFANL